MSGWVLWIEKKIIYFDRASYETYSLMNAKQVI